MNNETKRRFANWLLKQAKMGEILKDIGSDKPQLIDHIDNEVTGLVERQLEFEKHCDECTECFYFHARICTHCLELRIVRQVIATPQPIDGLSAPTLPTPTLLVLCTKCRTSTEKGELVVA